MKKLIVLGAGLAAVGSAALISAGVATSDPANAGSMNVVGEPYSKALQILKSQGVKATFGGSVGSDLPQSMCMVNQQKVTSRGRMLLMLDCTEKAAKQMKDSGSGAAGGAPGGPTVGSNGITTVTPTPVAPIPGAPGAGTPPPPA